MAKGWIKVHRALLEHGIFQNAELLQVWMYCLLQATYQEKDYPLGRTVVHLQPGQLLCGRRSMSNRLGVNENQLRKNMGLLEQLGAITIESTNRYSIVTIVNWALYQQEMGKAEFPFDVDFFADDEVSFQPEACRGGYQPPTGIGEKNDNIHQPGSQSASGLEGEKKENFTSNSPAGHHKQKEKKIIKQNKKTEKNKKENQITEQNTAQKNTTQQKTEPTATAAAVVQRAMINQREQKPTMQAAQAMMDRLWQQYPIQKGRYKISTQQMMKLAQVGEPALQQAIQNYCAEKRACPRQYWQQGGTFFNGGYEDYLHTPQEQSASAMQQVWEGL